MAATPYFSGGNEGPTHRQSARRIAERLSRTQPDLGLNLLYSAASYVLRDRRNPTDSVVVTEARKRVRHVERAIAARERRFER